VHPVAARPERLVGHRPHQAPSDPETLEVRVHRGIQDERVGSAVPDGVHEADQTAGAERADPSQAVPLEPLRPRADDGVFIWAVRAERQVVQRRQRGVVNREPDLQHGCHRVKLPVLEP
jgi:hypothetical protein